MRSQHEYTNWTALPNSSDNRSTGYPPELRLSDATSSFSSQEAPLATSLLAVHSGKRRMIALAIIRTSRQDGRVSLSPRSGRNERSERRTARRAVDRRGVQPLSRPTTSAETAPQRRATHRSGLSGSPGVRRDETSPIQRVEFPPRQGPV